MCCRRRVPTDRLGTLLSMSEFAASQVDSVRPRGMAVELSTLEEERAMMHPIAPPPPVVTMVLPCAHLGWFLGEITGRIL